MRGLAFLIGLMFAPCAAAQEADLGGLRLGMSIHDAVAAGVTITRHGNQPLPQRFTGRLAATEIAGLRARGLHVVFDGGVIDSISSWGEVRVERAEDCVGHARALVEVIERVSGPMRRQANEPRVQATTAPIITPGGSYIRRYDADGRVSATASELSPIGAEVRAGTYEASTGTFCNFSFFVASSAPLPELPPETIGAFSWQARLADAARFYPPEAMDQSRSGHAILVCTVGEAGALDCAIGFEGPPGWGYGEAAMRVATRFIAPPANDAGEPTVGKVVHFSVPFRIPYN